jgi:hypothetical protein
MPLQQQFSLQNSGETPATDGGKYETCRDVPSNDPEQCFQHAGRAFDAVPGYPLLSVNAADDAGHAHDAGDRRDVADVCGLLLARACPALWRELVHCSKRLLDRLVGKPKRPRCRVTGVTEYLAEAAPITLA